MKIHSFVLLIFTVLLINCQNKPSADRDKDTLNHTLEKTEPLANFERIPNQISGLKFNNLLTHDFNSNFNLFDFDFFYNGGGVGVEDINNDGLLDVFFCGNQVPNKLFLNKGNLQFEDITATANINSNKQWSNGVTFADVNNDGWIDIYVSQGGPYPAESRSNLLLINQKNNSFKEEADTYGLNDQGISTQAAFFDYDKDGDLDCFVMNESQYYGFDPVTFNKILENEEALNNSSCHFYENKNGVFTDITKEAGLLNASFGLGLCIADINNDNWLDIYVANDYYVPDAIYISNQKGGFTDEIKTYTNQVAFYGMGVDIADLNNDNRDDIFVLDMAAQDHVRSKTLMASMNVPQFELLNNQLGYQTQFMYNSLQYNLGNNKFQNISQYAGLSKTDWSWAGLIFDYDLDSKNDVYVTNGYRRYALDNDVRTEIRTTKNYYKGKVPTEVKAAIYDKLPSEKLPNILYKNTGHFKFKNVTSNSGIIQPSFSNGAAYADLDNDGDLDLLVNNMDSPAFLFKNTSVEQDLGNFLTIVTNGNLSEDFAKVKIHFNNQTIVKESRRVRGYLSAVDKHLHFGLGKVSTVDRVEVFWPSGRYQEFNNINPNSTLIVKESEANFENPYALIPKNTLLSEQQNTHVFEHIENKFNDFEKEVLLPYKQSTLGPYFSSNPVNSDLESLLYIGGASNQSGVLFKSSKNQLQQVHTTAFNVNRYSEDMESLFVDIDSDGDQDLFVVSGGSEFEINDSKLQDRIYLNNGSDTFTLDKSSGLENFKFNGKSVASIDFDNDGDYDLIVGNRVQPQHYPIAEPSFIFENRQGKLYDITKDVCVGLQDFGIINKVLSTDINNDGWMDFIAVGEWTEIGVFVNEQGKFKNIAEKSNLNNQMGWWFSITETDINNDGFKDYLIGNVGENLKFKVNRNQPLRVYADDFDDNGSLDIVLSQKYNGEFVPSRGKECSSQQMPFIKEKIPTYFEFANSNLEDIYGSKIHTAYQKEANQFKSLLLVNNGDSTFKMVELPPEVQMIPILDTETLDINKDGYEDVIVVGNIYNTEVETPRLDNCYALILESNTLDNYNIIGPNESGIYYNGNAKSIKLIKDKLLIGLNNGEVKTFKFNDF